MEFQFGLKNIENLLDYDCVSHFIKGFALDDETPVMCVRFILSGISRLRGILLYELQQTLLQKARKLYNSKKAKNHKVITAVFRVSYQRFYFQRPLQKRAWCIYDRHSVMRFSSIVGSFVRYFHRESWREKIVTLFELHNFKTAGQFRRRTER